MSLREKILQDAVVDFAPYEEFYNSKEFEPRLPEKPHWRHWRFRCADGTWRKCQRTIKSVNNLRHACLEYAAIDVYYSTSAWLNPKNKSSKTLTGKKGASYAWADNNLLFSDLYFDFDASNINDVSGLEIARQETLWVAEQQKPDSVRYIQFTGGRGFGIEILKQTVLPAKSAARTAAVEKQRKLYINALQKQRVLATLDDDTTTDALRVKRCPGTPNSKTGRISRILSIDELRQSTVQELINRTPKLNSNDNRHLLPKRPADGAATSKGDKATPRDGYNTQMTNPTAKTQRP